MDNYTRYNDPYSNYYKKEIEKLKKELEKGTSEIKEREIRIKILNMEIDEIYANKRRIEDKMNNKLIGYYLEKDWIDM